MKICVGFIVYGDVTAKYLPYFLPSLLDQDSKDLKIIAVDNTEAENNPNSEYLRKNFPQVELEWSSGENLGFARAYNKMIKKAVAMGTEYFLAVNPDMIFEKNFISRMLSAIETEKNIASVAPKILRWNFADNKKTNIIDSCGIKLRPGLRFYDVGQGEEDKGQYDNIEILGPSGAAALYRIEALDKVAFGGQYFDELMFMYKEDCDLDFRFQLAGYKAKLASNAIAYHDRSVAGEGESDMAVALNRKNKSRQSKKWSFLNQQLIYAKYWCTLNWKDRLALICNQVKLLAFITIFEQYLFLELPRLYQLRKKVKYYYL